MICLAVFTVIAKYILVIEISATKQIANEHIKKHIQKANNSKKEEKNMEENIWQSLKTRQNIKRVCNEEKRGVCNADLIDRFVIHDESGRRLERAEKEST